MTVNVSKPAINLRSKLAELDKPTGIAGEAMLRAETPQEQFNLIGAGRRNLIINGDMQVNQRGGSHTLSSTISYTLDRMVNFIGSSYNYDVTVSQDTDAPPYFSKSMKVVPNSVVTGTGGQNGGIGTTIEASSLYQLGYGTSSARVSTLSFWVKSNKTGLYSLQIGMNYNSTTASNKTGLYTSYTIDAADVWEKKVITIPACSTIGLTDGDISQGWRIMWWHYSHPDDDATVTDKWITNSSSYRGVPNDVDFLDSTSNYWKLTGVQLELGKVATPFEHRSYGEELALCQRYYQKYGSNLTYLQYSAFAAFYYIPIPFPVEMRATPSGSISVSYLGEASSAQLSGLTKNYVNLTYQTTGTAGRHGFNTGTITLDAEL